MLTIKSIDRNPGVLTYTTGGRVMATRWFDVNDGWAFLVAGKVDGKFRVSWQYGEDQFAVQGTHDAPRAVSMIARDTIKPFALRSSLECSEYEFGTLKQAKAAVEAANQALQAAFPMEAPPWATLALVHGWTPPEAG